MAQKPSIMHISTEEPFGKKIMTQYTRHLDHILNGLPDAVHLLPEEPWALTSPGYQCCCPMPILPHVSMNAECREQEVCQRVAPQDHKQDTRPSPKAMHASWLLQQKPLLPTLGTALTLMG